MSPNVSSFVHDLVEMAKATEHLPRLEAENHELRSTVDRQAEVIQRLEMRLIDHACEIADLYDVVRKAEVSRDDAELRFLEADEKAERAVRALDTILGSAKQARDELSPPPPPPPAQEVAVQSPEPVSGVSPVESHTTMIGADPTANRAEPIYGTDWGVPQGQSEPFPPAQPAEPFAGQSVAASAPAQPEVATSTGPASEGVSVPSDPTAQSTEAQSAPTAPSAEPVMESIPQTSGTEPGPYTSKLYIDTPGWIGRAEWLDGGGTPETYDWRSGDPLPEGFVADHTGRHYKVA